MDSPRERDSVGQQWKMSRTTDTQSGVHGIALQRVMIELGKLRRRIVGGGGTTASTGVDFKGEWSPTETYKAKVIVFYVTPGGAAGAYISLKSVTAGISPDTGSPNWVAFPAPAPGMFGS